MMKYRQKPSGIWLVDYEDDVGGRKRVSTGIKTVPMKTPPPEVKQAGREIVLGLRDPVVPSGARQARKGDGPLTMSDLFDRCEKTVWAPSEAKSQATIRSNLKVLHAEIGTVPILDMTYSRLEKVVENMRTRGYAPATIKRKLDMVSKALRMATIWSDKDGRPLLVIKPPMPSIRISNLKDRTVSSAEESAIFQAVEQRRQDEPQRQWYRMAALLRFLFDTGARLGEALGVGPDNITAMGGNTYVTFARYRTKNDKPRSIPLTPGTQAVLASLMAHLGRDKPTGELRYFPLNNGTAWYMFDQIREDVKLKGALNLDDVTLHTLRHTTLTRLAKGGMDLLRLQAWAGHSDPKITAQRYTHLSPSDLAGGLSILAASIPTPGTIQGENTIEPVTVPITEAGANCATLGTPSYH
jgi:integrase